VHARRHRPPLSASPITPGSIKVTKRHDEGDTIPGKKAGNVPPFAAMHGPKHARRQPLLVQGIARRWRWRCWPLLLRHPIEARQQRQVCRLRAAT